MFPLIPVAFAWAYYCEDFFSRLEEVFYEAASKSAKDLFSASSSLTRKLQNWIGTSLNQEISSLEPTNFQISLLHPRRLAKGCSSIITVQIYLPYRRPDAVSRIESIKGVEPSELIENTYPSVLIPGLTVIIKLSSPDISFSDEVLKELRGEYVNRVTFTAQPDKAQWELH